MRPITNVFLVLAFLFSISACSWEEARQTVEEYADTPTSQIAEKLLKDGSEASNRAKKIAWCQAKAISDSGLPKAVVDALTKRDGRSVVERAKSLNRPGLAKKLRVCVKNNS